MRTRIAQPSANGTADKPHDLDCYDTRHPHFARLSREQWTELCRLYDLLLPLQQGNKPGSAPEMFVLKRKINNLLNTVGIAAGEKPQSYEDPV